MIKTQHKIGERVNINLSSYSYVLSLFGVIKDIKEDFVNKEYCPELKDTFYLIEFEDTNNGEVDKIKWVREQQILGVYN